MNVLGYLEEVLLFLKELLCNLSLLSLLELCSMLTFGVHCFYFGVLCYSKYVVHKIWYYRLWSLVGSFKVSHPNIFFLTFFGGFSDNKISRVLRGHSEVKCVKILESGSLHFLNYRLGKLGPPPPKTSLKQGFLVK
jgi:hypothetical protein